jgi:hypothetical protein
MDVDRARELAIAEFATRHAWSGGSWRLEDWEISEGYEQEVYGPRGARPCLVFAFAPRESEATDAIPLRVIVDKETGETDLLR